MTLLSSSPSYPDINDLWQMYAIVKNPALFAVDNDLETWDIANVCAMLECAMQDCIDGVPVEFVKGLARANG